MNSYKTIKRIFLCSFLGVVFIPQVYSSVTLVGTRIIYPEDKKSVSLNFRSSDRVPSIIDTWVSKNPVSESNDNDAPFVITPSIFRIDPNKGQSIKLIYSGADLPNDRESVFYFNFVQMPAAEKNVNKLLVTYKSTVKIFYRPGSLKGSVDDMDSSMKMDVSKLKSGVVTVVNNSEYHVTPVKVSFKKNGKEITSVAGDALSMIPPFGHLDINVPPQNDGEKLSADISMINDLGGIIPKKIMTK